MSTGRTYTGKNVDAAVAKAAAELGMEPGALSYDVLAGAGGGFALIRISSGAAAPSGEAPSERLTGQPGAGGSGGGDDDRRDDRRDRRDRGDRGDRDRGGRGRGRGRDRDRDRGGRGRGRDRDRGGRGGRGGDRRGGRRGSGRGSFDAILSTIPTDASTDVKMTVAEGIELSEIGEDAHEVIKDLLIAMGFGVEIVLTEDDDQIRMDIQASPYSEALAAEDMKLLQAIEHIVDKTVNFDADDRKKILLDVDGLRAKQDEDLGASAREVADRVLAEGKTVKMGPLDARSRRLVHIALRDVKGVTTQSEGEGAFRRVCVMPEEG